MTDNLSETSQEAWQRLGFTETNISSIGGDGKRNPAQRIADIKTAIDTHEETLASLMDQTGLKPSNISSMLSNSKARGAEAIEALCEDDVVPKVAALTTGRELDDDTNKEPPFIPYQPTTISSILGSSSAEIEQAVSALYKARPALQHFMDETAMELKNVSSMFQGAGTAIKKGAEKLTTADGEKTPTDKKRELLAMRVTVRGEEKPLFTPNNISSMLHKAGTNTAEGIDALYAAKGTFKELIESGRWEMKNLSSMLNDSGQNIGKAITDLNQNIPTLQNIMDETDFTAENLSSMLSGAGQHIGKAITDLSQNIPTLQDIMNDTDFTAENLSSMLSGAGQHIGKAITDLSQNIPTLQGIMDETDFTAENLSSMLSSAGQHIGKAITEGLRDIRELDQKVKTGQNQLLEEQRYTHSNISSAIHGSAKVGDGIAMMLEKWDKLVALVKKGGYDAQNITQKLSKKTFSKRAALIDGLPANIDKDTDIPAGAGAAIASTSQAASQQTEPEK